VAVASDGPASDTGQEGWTDRIERWWKSTPNLKVGYEAIIKSASDWSAKIVRLIAIFVMQTIVIPLGILFMAWRLARLAMRFASTGVSQSCGNPASLRSRVPGTPT
jgi:hypothetical protein